MSNQISSLTSAVYTSRSNLLDLMHSQGYNVEDHLGFSIVEINTMKMNNQLDMILENTKEDEVTKIFNKVYIRHYLLKPLRPDNLDAMVDDLFNIEQVLTKSDTLFIIVKDDINETLTNKLKQIWDQDKIFIIILSIKRLQFNILNHVLVPPHRILSITETLQIKKRYNIMTDDQFPIISRFDAVSQAIGIRPGQVCEIIRPSKTAISAPYYRICA